MKSLSVLSLAIAALASVSAHAAIPCQKAMEKAIQEPGTKSKVISTSQVSIGDEPLVEVSQVVMRWYPDSESNSSYYYLVTATCRKEANGYELYDDMPGEGGVTVKTISKARY